MDDWQIGVDLVDLNRLSLDNRLFLERILSSSELERFDQIKNKKQQLEFLGGRYAAKEAVLKALGTGIGGMPFKDISVLNKESGEPYLNIPHSKISISHEDHYAIAFVMLKISKE